MLGRSLAEDGYNSLCSPTTTLFLRLIFISEKNAWSLS